MPPFPKINDVRSLVGTVEVAGENYVKHQTDAECHVGIATEIEVELEGIGKTCHPRLKEVE